MFKITNLTVLLCLALLASCGEKSHKSNNGISINGFKGMSALRVNESVNYQSDCYVQKIDGQSSYQMSRFEIKMTGTNEADFSMKTAIFDENCETSLVENEMNGYGKFSQENRLFEADLIELLMRSLHDMVTESLNENKACGISNWVTFQAQDVIDTECFEGSQSNDIYINAQNNGAKITVYMCEDGQPLSKKCESVTLNRM